MKLSLKEFLSDLERFTERVPLDYLVERMEKLDITIEQVREYVQFGTTTYRRNLMHAGSGFSALILCWRSGQRSPIHDHRGSSCGVRVLLGEATETVFDRTPDGHVYATNSRTLGEGLVCGSEDMDIHQVSNLQGAGRDLVTLHVYSPPLMQMGTYTLESTRVGVFEDPVYEFSHGGGI